MASRWIRLDTTWSKSEWIADLGPPSRLAWIQLLCYMKSHGTAGAVKRLSAKLASREWGVTRDAVTKLLNAAIKDGALLVDGDEWIITGWSDRQMDPTAAARSRRYRQRQQELTDADEALTMSPDTTVTRDDTPVTSTETKTETGVTTKRETRAKRKRTVPGDWAPNPHHQQIAITEGVDLDREAHKFYDWAASNGKLYIDWDRAFNNWLRNAKDFNGHSRAKGKPGVGELAAEMDAHLERFQG